MKTRIYAAPAVAGLNSTTNTSLYVRIISHILLNLKALHNNFLRTFFFKKLVENLNSITYRYKGLYNPLSPHDALNHHFTSLKTYLIFLQLKVLK